MHFYLFMFVSIIAPSVLAQTEEEQILNNVLNAEPFIEHLSGQEVIDLTKAEYMLPSELMDTNWQLYFQNERIEFNTALHTSAIGFDRGYDFELIAFRKKRKKATVTLNFFPSYYPCSEDGNSYLGQTNELFISLYVELLYENGNWSIRSVKIEDGSFEAKKSKYPCITTKYKKYNPN